MSIEGTSFEVRHGGGEGSPFLKVSGDVDPSTAPALDGEITTALAGVADPPALVLDLSAVEFMDSSGLRVLISAVNAVRERGGTVTVHQPSETVAQLLHITQLTGVLDITT
jgi:anti-sigma B factor antagonist